jgi:hypothetical protein
MIKKDFLKALEATARAGGLSESKINCMVAAIEDQRATPALPSVLMTQAAKARQLGISRFTVRKLVQAGKLHPVELLPGFVRYRADELV